MAGQIKILSGSIAKNYQKAELDKVQCIHVTERSSNFDIEDYFALNCTLKYCRISQEKRDAH